MILDGKSPALRAVAALSIAVLGIAWSLSLMAPSHAADPPTLRLGYGSAAEEQLYLLLARPEMGKSYGKTYKLDASRFQSSTQRAQAFEANAIDLASSG